MTDPCVAIGLQPADGGPRTQRVASERAATDVTDGNDVSAPAPLGPWRWLVELREHLVPAIEIVTPAGEALLPAARGDLHDRLRRWLRRPASPVAATVLREAWRHAQARTPHFALADGLRIAALGVRTAHGERIVLCLAERADSGRDSSRRADLTRLAMWLARALASAARTSLRDWHEVTVLHQVLQRTLATGAPTTVIQAYVDALAIWSDTNTRAYLGNQAGRYVLEVALAGAQRAEAPRSLPADALAPLRHRRRLTPIEAAYYGFTGDDEVIVSPLRLPSTAPWLLVYAGQFSPADEDRLSLFEEMLLPALQAAAEVEASRLTWTLMQPLADQRRPAQDAALEALAELERATLSSAALQVTHRRDGLLIGLGAPLPAAAPGASWPAHAVQRLSLAVPPPYDAVLTVWRPPDRPFTQREIGLASTAATLLAGWTREVVGAGTLAGGTSPSPGERRRSRGEARDVSLLVILPEPADTAAVVREGWLDDLRRQLRPADIVGAVASGDIGVLLPATAEPDAHAVAARLGRLFAHHQSLALLDGAPIAVVATRQGFAPPQGPPPVPGAGTS